MEVLEDRDWRLGAGDNSSVGACSWLAFSSLTVSLGFGGIADLLGKSRIIPKVGFSGASTGSRYASLSLTCKFFDKAFAGSFEHALQGPLPFAIPI
jgi:hypothetical protein